MVRKTLIVFAVSTVYSLNSFNDVRVFCEDNSWQSIVLLKYLPMLSSKIFSSKSVVN